MSKVVQNTVEVYSNKLPAEVRSFLDVFFELSRSVLGADEDTVLASIRESNVKYSQCRRFRYSNSVRIRDKVAWNISFIVNFTRAHFT